MCKYLVLFFLVIIYFTSDGQNVNFDWAVGYGGHTVDDIHAITTDKSGNFYSAGSYQGNIDFDSGPGTYTVSTSTAMVVLKQDGAGNLIWAKTIHQIVHAFGIRTDNQDNVYISGSFKGTVDFDPGATVYNVTSDAFNSFDIFTLKLDSQGNFLWVKIISGDYNDQTYSMELDKYNNIYTTGRFRSTVDFDPGIGIYNLVSSSLTNDDIFISKLDSNGVFKWAKCFKGLNSSSLSFALDVDSFCNVYTTGQFSGTVDFDPGLGTFNLTSSTGDIFISKLDSSGSFIWGKQISCTYSGLGRTLVVDDIGTVYYGGSYRGTADFDPGPGTYTLSNGPSLENAFVSKLDPSGNFVWAKNFAGTGHNYVFSLAIDTNQNIYSTGNFLGTIDLNPNTPIVNIASNGNSDIFISKLDSTGSYIWAKTIGASGIDKGICLTLDKLENIFTAGIFSNTVDFDINSPVFNLTSAASTDVFLLKMGQNLTTGTNSTFIESEDRIYPNPNTGLFILDLQSQSNIKIVNILGEEVYQDYKTVGKHIIELQTSTGIYFLTITNNNNKQQIFKIVKQ